MTDGLKSLDPAQFLPDPYCHPLAEVSLHDLGAGEEEPCGNNWFSAGLLTQAIATGDASETGLDMTGFLIRAAGYPEDQGAALIKRVRDTVGTTDHEAAVRDLICQLATGFRNHCSQQTAPA